MMSMKININYGIISQSNTKFSEHHKNCMTDSEKSHLWDLESETVFYDNTFLLKSFLNIDFILSKTESRYQVIAPREKNKN